MATLPGYLCLGGNELVNVARVLHYIRTGQVPGWSASNNCDCSCGIFDEGNYSSPGGVSNPAPWYDPVRPESAQFFGIIPSDFHLSTPLLAPSAASQFGRSCVIPVPRVITLDGDLVASTAAGAAYGREWLVRSLVGTCVGSCCPPREMTLFLWCEPGDSEGGNT